MNALVVTVVAAVLLASSGCGATSPAASISSAATTTAPTASTQLTAAVRATLIAHHRLSVRALWSNEVTSKTGVVIAGPALADLRQAAAARRQRGVRVRLISEQFRINSIRLDPSYTTAVAIVNDPQRVRPYGYDGRPLGRSVTLDEHARIELHRLDRSQHFVVWKVIAIQ